jgi:hypothetical protein
VLDLVKGTFPVMKPGVDAMLGILPFYHIYGTFPYGSIRFPHYIALTLMRRRCEALAIPSLHRHSLRYNATI